MRRGPPGGRAGLLWSGPGARSSLGALSLGALLFAPCARAQSAGEAALALRTEEARVNLVQSSVLAGWSGASMLVGAGLALGAPRGVAGRSVGVNTVAWGAINMAIAIPGLVAALRDRASLPAAPYATAELAMQRDAGLARNAGQGAVFALNLGLDVAYLATGSLLCVLAERLQPRVPILLGVGIAALVQGSFLFALDAAGWTLAQGRHGAWLALRVPLGP